MSQANLGSAVYTIEANTTALVHGLMVAQQQVGDFSRRVNASLATLPAQMLQIIEQSRQTNRELRDLGSAMQQVAAQATGMNRAFGGGGGERMQMFRPMMQMAILADDIQYGFRSIVNNIPHLGYAIGQTFGLGKAAAEDFGGALGLAAVAINTWIKNWESAKEVFGDTAPFRAAEDAINSLKDAVLSEMAKMMAAPTQWSAGWLSWAINPALGGLVPGVEGGMKAQDMQRMAADKKALAEDRESAQKARKQVRELQSEEMQRTAKQFKEAMGEFNAHEPERLRREMLEARRAKERDPEKLRRAMEDIEKGVTPRGKAQEDLFKRAGDMMHNVDRVIREGLKGGLKPGDITEGAFGREFFGKFLKAGVEHEERRMEERQRDMDRFVKGMMAIPEFAKKEGDKLLKENKHAQEDFLKGMMAVPEFAKKEGDKLLEQNKRRTIEALAEAKLPLPKHQRQSEIVDSAEFWERSQKSFFEAPQDIARQQLESLNKMLDLMAKLVKQGLMTPEQAQQQAQRLWGARAVAPED